MLYVIDDHRDGNRCRTTPMITHHTDTDHSTGSLNDKYGWHLFIIICIICDVRSAQMTVCFGIDESSYRCRIILSLLVVLFFFFLFVHFLRSFIVFIDAKRERCAPRHELIGQAFYIHFHFMFVCVLCFLANGSHSGRSWSVTIPWLAKFLRCWWSSKCAPLCDTWSVPRARRWCNWVARNFAIKCEYHIHMSTNHNNTHSIEAIGGT